MGLDNIPRELACVREGTTIKRPSDHTEDGFIIDCTATIEAHACPWHRDLGAEEGGVQGLFGTFCWYRGKSGMAMIALLPDDLQHAPNQGFYGPTDDGLTVEQCIELADWMADRAEAYARAAHQHLIMEQLTDDELRKRDEYAVKQWRYAIKWLRWAAAECDGTVAWW